MKKRTYKNGEPFEGNFDNHFLSGLIINENYVKGLKEGESIVKSDKDSIVAKGIYKNDKPYNGTFIVKIGEDDYELVHLVDFKKNGLQKVFKYNIDDVIKTYTCVNDVINGETIFYESGQVTGKLEYKNGLPYEGKLVKAESATIYKNGVITEEIFYMSNYESKDETNILKSKYYTNGKLSKIANRSFAIADDVKDSYEGIYKNEQPYSGYFSADLREFNYVDYYEKGEKKYQFSNNYLENLDNYKHPNYNIKSTYKDGKIIDGVEYIKFDRQFISKYWKNGVLQAFDCDLFATHYFNRFHFELKNNTISITEFNTEKTGKISRQKIGNKYVSQLIIGEKVIMSVSSLEINDVIPEETGSIVYYESDNTIEAKILSSEEINYEGRKESELMYEIFSSSINSSITMEENFNLLADNFSKGKNIEGMFGKGDTAYVLTGIRFNEAKKPEIGTLILKNKNNSYDLKSFFKRKIFEEKKNIELKNIKQEIEILAASFQKKLNEDFK
ncbi:hypothetical protein SGQ44_01315 [Flavobacterium sp. Fl-77]|uniref:Antitoxin component YwqK of the YwqJK toxin-antitoxin module n=1 Tax=Flavobacterium flavipigmentatum TaxID=2893884 RepID=A0AAJ2SDJ8_9FLAO|nr:MULTISPECIES: hypothetical protein [unclassified Flavobacterium]MDX6180774.1 hypothetical protein [Flavobacterium sp. Fl-33]MDX6184374.1 hypothetical protein [Flavobacterium sp. Fl-77]UFH39483.1 hypothetical protein LNP22_04210 [Flavobacterium sp. F-70]